MIRRVEITGSVQIVSAEISILNMVYEEFHRKIPSHCHGDGCYELHYIEKGRGSAYIGQETYCVTPETLYVTGPYIQHAQAPDADDPMCEYCVYLRIKQKTLDSACPQEARTLRSFLDTRFWLGRGKEAGALIKRCFEEAEAKKPGYEIICKALVMEIVVACARLYEKAAESVKGSGLSAVPDRTAITIEEYFLYQYRDFTMEGLAKRLGLSCRQTQRVLQKLYGMTFRQKKTEARMAAASMLLRHSDKSISVIASDLGYSCAEHFAAAFKRYYQTSPRAYRKKISQL